MAGRDSNVKFALLSLVVSVINIVGPLTIVPHGHVIASVSPPMALKWWITDIKIYISAYGFIPVTIQAFLPISFVPSKKIGHGCRIETSVRMIKTFENRAKKYFMERSEVGLLQKTETQLLIARTDKAAAISIPARISCWVKALIFQGKQCLPNQLSETYKSHQTQRRVEISL